MKRGGFNSAKVVLPLLMLASLVAGYWVFFQRMALMWDSGDNSYGYLVVPLFFYLCWEKRERFRFDEFAWSRLGIVTAFLAITLIYTGEAGSIETLLFAGLWAGIGAILVTLYGTRIKHLLFPLVILLFIIPLPPYINQALTFQLKLLASHLSVVLLRLSGVSVLIEGNILDLGVSRLQVVDACSGLRYVVPMFLLALLIGHMFTAARWVRAVIVVLAIPLTIVVNALRIWVTGLLAVNDLAQFAEGGAHDSIGLLMFLASGGLLLGVALFLRRFSSPPPPCAVDGGEAGGSSARRRSVWPAVCVCALFLAGGWAMPHLQASQQIAPPRTSFASFPMQIGEWQGTRRYLSQEVLGSLWADDYVSATFVKPGSGNVIHLLIPYYSYQGTRHTAHAPQSCILGSGWAVAQSREDTFAGDSGQLLPVMRLVLKKDLDTLLSAYYFLGRGRILTSPWRNKFFLIVDSFFKRRTDGALVRAEMSVAPGGSMDGAHQELTGFLSLLWHELPPYVPGGE